MTKRRSNLWFTWLAAGGLAGFIVAAGCGKNNWATGTEAGAGGAMGGQFGGADANVADVPGATGAGGAGGGGIGGSVIVDAPVATGGRVGTGGTGGGPGGVGDASAGPGGAGGAGGAKTAGGGGGGGGGLSAGGSGAAGHTGGIGGLGVGGAAGADAGQGGVGGAIAGTIGSGGAGGIGGFGGSASSGGLGGNTGGRSGSSGGAGGRLDAGSTGGAVFDAAVLPPGAIWTPYWVVPLCPSDFPTADCTTSSTSICTRGTSYDVYLCSSTRRWQRAPDDCPNLYPQGWVCTGQYTCYYPSVNFCTCAENGATAVCTDIRFTTLLSPPDAGPPPDASPPRLILACPAEPQGAACDVKVTNFCVLPNVLDLCVCFSGKWSCPATTTCPATIDNATLCDPANTDMRCLGEGNRFCRCIPTGLIACIAN